MAFRSRTNTAPYTAPDGHVVERRIDAGVIEILSSFKYHRYISSPFGAAMWARNLKATQDRLKELREDGVALIKICDYQLPRQQKYPVGFLYHDIAPAGIELLRKYGVDVKPPRLHKHFVHNVFIHQVMQSFAIGMRENPAFALDFYTNTRLHLGRRNGIDRYIISDYPYTAIRRVSDSRRRHIVAQEEDTSNEPIRSDDLDRSGIRNKLVNYIDAIERDLFQKQYGFEGDDFYIPFITHNPVRLDHMLECAEEVTKNKKWLRKHFPMKWQPTIDDLFNKPRPTGHMFTEPWKRPDYADLQLDK